MLQAIYCSLAFGICIARVARVVRVVVFCKVYANKSLSWRASRFVGFEEGCALAQNLRSPPKKQLMKIVSSHCKCLGQV